MTPKEKRYETMRYTRCGKSGLKLPRVSLGLWHNFGTNDSFENMTKMCLTAFDLGITHFDIANNYGPLPGSAEENFGRILKQQLSAYRDELIVSTKAGYHMWEGPYGDGGSLKYMTASLDQSLRRLGLEYVDIFYHHRPDNDTPVEESMLALDRAVKSGKALYAGLSNYSGEQMLAAARILEELKCPFVINQNRYSILDRGIEQNGLLAAAGQEGKGLIIYSPLAQGLPTDRYLDGVPEGSRAKKNVFLKEASITPEKIQMLCKLREVARQRGETLAQMALAWVLRKQEVTGVLIGASCPEQIRENVGVLASEPFCTEQEMLIDTICREG